MTVNNKSYKNNRNLRILTYNTCNCNYVMLYI